MKRSRNRADVLDLLVATKHASQVRLYAILARKAPFGVIFRRGPSNCVLLIGWNLQNDTFQAGQWLKGRIYERRCDLSPSGDMLLYFAANYRKPYFSWSAISRPPFLTALALWPKGDGWGGGGHFVTARRIELNHRKPEMGSAEGFALPKWLKVDPFGEHPGRGEDDPIWAERLMRDGWKLLSYPSKTKDDYGARVWMEFSPAITWQKRHPRMPKQCALEMRITGIKERNGPWYLTEHSVICGATSAVHLGRSEWADWDRSGDLLYTKDGALYRLRWVGESLLPVEHAKKIGDFTDLEFRPLEAPEEARRWP